MTQNHDRSYNAFWLLKGNVVLLYVKGKEEFIQIRSIQKWLRQWTIMWRKFRSQTVDLSWNYRRQRAVGPMLLVRSWRSFAVEPAGDQQAPSVSLRDRVGRMGVLSRWWTQGPKEHSPAVCVFGSLSFGCGRHAFGIGCPACTAVCSVVKVWSGQLWNIHLGARTVIKVVKGLILLVSGLSGIASLLRWAEACGSKLLPLQLMETITPV